MKKKAFKEILKYVRVIVFFAVITILVEAVNYVMVQPGYARYIILQLTIRMMALIMIVL